MNINTIMLEGTIRRAYLDGETAQEIAQALDLPVPDVEVVVKKLELGTKRDAQMRESFADGEHIKSIAARWGVQPVVVLRVVGRSEEAKALRKSRTLALKGSVSEDLRAQRKARRDLKLKALNAQRTERLKPRRQRVARLHREGLSPRAIATRLKCSITTVRNDMASMGISSAPRRPDLLEDDHLVEVARLTRGGASISDLMQRFNLSREAIRYRLTQVGLGPQGVAWFPDAHELRDSLQRWGRRDTCEEYGATARMLRVWMKLHYIKDTP